MKETDPVWTATACPSEAQSQIFDRDVVTGELKRATSEDFKRAFNAASRMSFKEKKTVEEFTLEAVKEKLRREWLPEYKPEEIRPPQESPDTISERATNVTLSMLFQDAPLFRKTKVICTMGPKCWSEEGMGRLIDAGMDVMRMNFSHGSHEGHYDVLRRFRKVCDEKRSYAASLLDTKGPEIRTAMLKGHEPILLKEGQEVIVESVGERYTEFEGYSNEEETRIGLSYGQLCQSVSPGNKILMADGTITMEVLEILNDKELKGRVLNTKSLGERKNCNLPGVKVDIPVLTAKDIEDLQQFACQHHVDFVAVSFVQSAGDVQFVRKVLDDAGGHSIKIISKIENEAGLDHFDEILACTDGVMVARGDLGMEIPSEKVPVAQKMIITKCNIAGKFAICATQMLESMISNPLPTRAEMTDVANAVYDGADGVMLSGETANGAFPDKAVATMAAIVANAEQAVDYYSQYSFAQTLKGDMTTLVLKCINYLEAQGIDMRHCKVIVAHNQDAGSADSMPSIKVLRTDVGLKRTMRGSAPVMRRGTRTCRSTKTSLPLILSPVDKPRSTKIVCTMGPKCWSEGTMEELLAAGMDIMRLNFSHGTHKDHLDVLNRFRMVCDRKAKDMESKGSRCAPRWAALLDTKGPEIRTAMLKHHQAIDLEAGDTVVVEAVGDKYTSFEGYKTDKETRIGLSYAALCQSVTEGDSILLADGTISIKVKQVLNDREVLGTVMNTKSLGERKNCNLPGIKVQLPVLTGKDEEDLRNFACKHRMDFVAASFVQTAADVKAIRKVLDGAGGEDIKIISKIENWEGLKNFDDILKETDGVMVARGDLGMEIPAEKVPLAQKMIITKCNIAGKPVITATQMLESMINNPRPTRAEMTDVANAILDGTDGVMLSGETANGSFPRAAISTMAAICCNAEQMADESARFSFLRNSTPKPLSDSEAVASGAVMVSMDIAAKAIVVLTTSGRGAKLVSKYRPRVPVVVASPNERVVGQCRSYYGQFGLLMQHDSMELGAVVEAVSAYVQALGITTIQPTDQLVVVGRRLGASIDEQRLTMRTIVVGDPGGAVDVPYTAYPGTRTLFHRSTKVGLDTLLDEEKYKYVIRKTKIVCTMGPSCWSEDQLESLLKAGMNVARFNFSHGSHEAHLEVLERYRKVCKAQCSTAASLLDTKGPEIRTAMLVEHKPIQLEAGQDIIIEAGHKTEEETRIGLSYAKLCSSVVPGNKILLADGTVSIEVLEILNDTELRGRVANTKALGERKNCNLPGVKVDIPVLTEKDIGDLRDFCCKHEMDFVAASFVQSKADVELIRGVLDEAGGHKVKIISKIENAEGLRNFDEILEATDGVMVARGDLGMEIPVEKVPLAQKVMATKANIAGKFCICATQMLESMVSSPFPTRAEMTDVANAVFDGVDAVMLSGETANGANPGVAVSTMAKICRSAELGVNYYQVFDFVREFTPKPVGTVEAVASTLAKNAVDVRPGMVVAFSEEGKTARLIAKYRPCCPVLVVTSNPTLSRQASVLFSAHVMLLDKKISGPLQACVTKALQHGVDTGICTPGKEVLVLTSTAVTSVMAGGIGDGAKQLPERESYATLAPGTVDYQKLGFMAPFVGHRDPTLTAKTVCLRSTVIDLPMLTGSTSTIRKTKIVATLGPKCCGEDTMAAMLDAGLNAIRVELHQNGMEEAEALMKRFREVSDRKGARAAIIADVVGPLFHAQRLDVGGSDVDSVDLSEGMNVYVTCSEASTSIPKRGAKGLAIWLGGGGGVGAVRLKDRLTHQGGLMQFAIEKEVEDSWFVGRVLVPGRIATGDKIGDANCDLTSPVILDTLRNISRSNKVEFFSMSLGCLEDVDAVRDALEVDKEPPAKIIARIERNDQLKEVFDIIDATDGIIVSRGALGGAITPQKVALAQNVLITRTNVAGKVVITTGQMLESMIGNPRPTRAEMTDVANSVFDGTDCIMLERETSHGDFPVECIATADAILRNAETATNYCAVHSFIRDMSPKPFTTLDASASGVAKACVDAGVGIVIVVSNTAVAADLVAKYRPPTPQVVVTMHPIVASQAQINFGQHGCHVEEYGEDVGALLRKAMSWARGRGLVGQGESVAVMHGSAVPNADEDPVIRVCGAEAL
ncbi:unnamed protein product [Ostreobium quekettii]|uniref:Pyruvate kinase n=1 Tax=Ostreobium quekettii TaxID=121088 RepID=A0A8S1JCE3_9CHLO|nr:unnamed protein product [Ostreobium quekettii]